MSTRDLPPTVFVLFGATGDLARRMVLPAIFELAGRGLLPERWALVGVDRRQLTDEDFRVAQQALAVAAEHCDHCRNTAQAGRNTL